jgi:hypothetical protein
MPEMVGRHINAPMIAEKAADLIRGRALLAPVGLESLQVIMVR